MSCVQASAPKGLDVIFDLVGGEPFREALKAARWGAHILFIGFASGDVPKVRLPESHSRGKVCSLRGSDTKCALDGLRTMCTLRAVPCQLPGARDLAGTHVAARSVPWLRLRQHPEGEPDLLHEAVVAPGRGQASEPPGLCVSCAVPTPALGLSAQYGYSAAPLLPWSHALRSAQLQYRCSTLEVPRLLALW